MTHTIIKGKTDFNDLLIDAVATAVEANPSDIPAAVRQVMDAIQENKTGYKNWRDDLVRIAVQELITDKRHSINQKARAGAATRFGESKAGSGSDGNGSGRRGPNESRADKGSDILERTYQTIYGYFIAGKTLGELTLDNLGSIEDDQRSKAHGVLCNAELLAWIRTSGFMKKNKTVRQCVPARLLKEKFDTIFGAPRVVVDTSNCDQVSA